ncbi:MAG: hypothetical protein Q4C54_08775 [Clostridia bacterium]|nr:hypothetical protein [Clostridia bacterium]
MNMIPLLLIAAIAVVTAVLVKIINRLKDEKSMANRVRSTATYASFYSMLKRYDTERVESVTIHPDGIVIRNFLPLGSGVQFRFASHHLDTPTPETLYAMAQAIMLDMTVLQNRSHYQFRTHTETRSGGEKIIWYDYMIKSARKTELIQADARRRNSGEG